MAIDKDLLLFPFGIAACLFGWASLAKGNGALENSPLAFFWNSANQDIRTFRGVLALILGPILILIGVLHFSGFFK